MWNGVNYILKMPSDLDYLADYLAIKKWMGFTLTRNPFCVPYPLDEGKEVLNSKLQCVVFIAILIVIVIVCIVSASSIS